MIFVPFSLGAFLHVLYSLMKRLWHAHVAKNLHSAPRAVAQLGSALDAHTCQV